jgi:inositol transport system ATP-binding protein
MTNGSRLIFRAFDVSRVWFPTRLTQGIDVGAISEIHALMTELAAQGVAILMISSELPEILGMSDRVAAMYGGQGFRGTGQAGFLQSGEAGQHGPA